MNWSGFYNLYRDVQAYVNPLQKFEQMITGRTQMRNTQKSLTAQMNYEQYLKQGNERALADWHKNVPGRSIKYPEFSYPGQIRRADTSIARAGLDYDTATANYYGNLAYRVGGLYGVSSRATRHL